MEDAYGSETSPTSGQDSVGAPDGLSKYTLKQIAATKSKSELVQYADCKRTLAELAPSASQKKIEKELDQILLPRLALYGTPGPDLIPLFLKLLEQTDEKNGARVIRYAYYFLERMVDKRWVREFQAAHADILINRMKQDIALPISSACPLRKPTALQVLSQAAASGCRPARAELRLATTAMIGHMLEGKTPKGKSTFSFSLSRSRNLGPDVPTPIMQTAVFRTIHNVFFADDELAVHSMLGGRCSDALGARHALAVASQLAQRDPALVAETMGPLVETTLAALGDPGHDRTAIPASSSPQAASPISPGASGMGLNLSDRFAPIHLAHVCAAVLHAPELQHSQYAASLQPFYRFLELQVIHSQHAPMLEAVRALAGAAPNPLPFDRRGRAWALIWHGGPISAETPLAEKSSALLATIVQKLQQCFQSSGQQAVRSSACRAAEALAEAHAHWDMSQSQELGTGGMREMGSEEAGHLATLARAVQGALYSRNTAIRATAMRAILWLRGSSFLPGAISALREQVHDLVWPKDAVGAVVSTIAARIRCTPALSEELLEGVRLVAEHAAARMAPEGVLQVWQTALTVSVPQEHRDKQMLGAMKAVEKFLAMLHSQSGSRTAVDPPAQVAAAHLALQRAAAWFLGENANYATSEYAWNDRAPSAPPFRHPRDFAAGGGAEGALAQAAASNPPMAQVVAELHRCVLAGAWGTRLEAVRALGKIAVRSREPFRVQCYLILQSCGASGMGLTAAVAPLLDLLTRMYDVQEELQVAWQTQGRDERQWPPEDLQRFASVHEQLVAEVSLVCFVPPQLYLPLGSGSASLLQECVRRQQSRSS